MLTATLGQLLNRGLPRSPRARQLCAQLAGKSVAIVVRDIVRLRVASDGLTLAVTSDALGADASIEGGPLGLAALGGAQGQAVLQRGDVDHQRRCGARAEIPRARRVAHVPTWRRSCRCSRRRGGAPPRRAWRAAVRAGRAARRDTTLANLAEYLAHERRDLVPRNEGEQFLRGVDALREGVDRLQARLELLARRRAQP